jgi:replicative DNA helicase
VGKAIKAKDNTEETLEFEQCFLGGLLIEPGNVPELTIKKDCFLSGHHAAIFAAFEKQRGEGLLPDLLTISADQDIKAAGIGASYIASLTNKTPSAANILYYENTIINAWKKRVSKKAAADFQEELNNPANADNIGEVINTFQEALARAQGCGQIDRLGSWEGFITECVTYEPDKDFMPELFHRLPFPPGTVSYIGARAKVGKTTALINLCREALFNNREVFFITEEMSRKQLLVKLILCTAYGMAAADNKTEDLDERDKPTKDCYALIKNKDIPAQGAEAFREYVTRAIEFIKQKYNRGFVIYDGRGAKFYEIITAIKAHTKPQAIVLLDYIQRMPAVDESGADDYTRVKKISDGVMNAAAQTNSVIISGAQFNRTVERDHEGNEVFELKTFRESGDIEQDGHNLIGMGRMAEPGSRYIKMLAAREEQVEDDAYLLRFAYKYSYMANNGKIKAPEAAAWRGASGISTKGLTKEQAAELKETAKRMRGAKETGGAGTDTGGDQKTLTRDMLVGIPGGANERIPKGGR